VKESTTLLLQKWQKRNTKMKESSYAGRESRDDIKRDPKYLRLTPDAKKAADKELEKGGMVDLGEELLEEMEFFPVAVEVPSELPNAEELLVNLKNEADDLVNSSYIDVEGNTIIVTFMRKSDAENYKEFARSLGIPEEYVEEPESAQDTQIEDELYEVVMDSNGNELFINDTIKVGNKKFKIAENNEGTASLFTLSGKEIIPISDSRAHTLLKHSVKEAQVVTDYQKRREAEADYKTAKKDVPPKSFKEPKNDYFARRRKELGEDLDIGHEDDEPEMLKSYVYEILDYATKLYKQLSVYDKMRVEVDFPNWWQAKVIKARDYISAAQHYLEAEEKKPELDTLMFADEKDIDESKQINERGGDLEDIIHDIRVHGEESGDVQGTAAEYIFYIANAFDINLNDIKDYLFEEEGPGELNKIYDVILKYVKDPDEAMVELDNFISGGKDGLSDELYANLSRDPEFVLALKSYLKEVEEGFYDSSGLSKREFKRKEMEDELGHETNDIGIFINNKLWKRLVIDPGMGYTEEYQRRQAAKIKNSIEFGAQRKGWKVPKVDISLIGSIDE